MGPGHARAEPGLARGRLPEPGRDDVPHDHLLDVLGGDARALDGGTDGLGAELGSRERRERAAKASDRRTRGAQEIGITHLERS